MKVQFSNGVNSKLKDGKLSIYQDEQLLVDEKDVFIPALWMDEKQIVAYSEVGYRDKLWRLPESWRSANRLELWEVTMNGKRKVGALDVDENTIRLNLSADQMLLIRPI